MEGEERRGRDCSVGGVSLGVVPELRSGPAGYTPGLAAASPSSRVLCPASARASAWRAGSVAEGEQEGQLDQAGVLVLGRAGVVLAVVPPAGVPAVEGVPLGTGPAASASFQMAEVASREESTSVELPAPAGEQGGESLM